MYDLEQIKKQNVIRGGWAIRVYYEELIARQLEGESIDFLNPSFFIENSFGFSANNTYKKLSKIFNLNFEQIPLKLDNCIQNELPIIENINDLPDKLQVEFWIEKLKEFLDTNDGNLTKNINDLNSKDRFTKVDSKEILYKWSFPIIESFYEFRKDLSYPDIKFLETEMALDCWRKWYWTSKFNQIFLIYPEERYGFGNNQWLIHCLIHDAAHLFHLSNYNQTCNPVLIENLALMESFAMQTEYRMYLQFEQGYEIEEELGTNFNTQIARAFNLIGLLERAFRIIYDKEVHLEKLSPQKWIDRIKTKYKIENEIYNFAYEFHGLPGLSTAYMLGMWTLEKEDETEAFLSNPNNNFIFKLNQWKDHERNN